MVRLVFDDGGFTHANPDESGFLVSPVVYDRLIQLAEIGEYEVGLACTAKYFDVDGLYSAASVNPHVDRICERLLANQDLVEVYNHGLTHRHESEFVEFFSYRTGPISEEIQSSRLALAQEILARVGFRPEVFVPPGHAWEEGITDKLCAAAGFSAIAVKEFEKKPVREWAEKPWRPYKKTWGESQHLKTLWRLGLGIRFDQTRFGALNYLKLSMIFRNDSLSRLAMNRRWRAPVRPSHYFAHVQNLENPDSLRFFSKALTLIRQAYESSLDR